MSERKRDGVFIFNLKGSSEITASDKGGLITVSTCQAEILWITVIRYFHLLHWINEYVEAL